MRKNCVVVNGKTLTDAEAEVVRVAVSSMLMEMQTPDSLGKDEHGRAMVALYRKALRDVERLFLGEHSAPL